MGAFSFFSPAPSGGSSGTLVSSSGTGGITGTSGSGGGGTFSFSSSTVSAPAPVQPSYTLTSYYSYSYPAAPVSSYQSPAISAYSLPGAGQRAGPFGERGPYTPLDFPVVEELRPGQRLEDVQTGTAGVSKTGWLLLGLLAVLMFTDKG